jgi:hypothetical protein
MPDDRKVARSSRPLAASLLLLAASACAARTSATPEPAAAPVSASRAAAGAATAPPRVAVLDVAFYGAGANSIERGDSATAATATARLRQALREAGTFELADSSRVSAAAGELAAAGIPCNTSLDCARKVGRRLGARWVVVGKVSKLSNLIWYFSGQLVDVDTGRLLMDDEFELKGVRDDMVPRGATALARRVVKAAQRASVAARGG